MIETKEITIKTDQEVTANPLDAFEVALAICMATRVLGTYSEELQSLDEVVEDVVRSLGIDEGYATCSELYEMVEECLSNWNWIIFKSGWTEFVGAIGHGQEVASIFLGEIIHIQPGQGFPRDSEDFWKAFQNSEFAKRFEGVKCESVRHETHKRAHRENMLKAFLADFGVTYDPSVHAVV